MFSPNASWYAVIRMDPVATVRHLNDPVATAAAEALSPKKYLVYLEHVSSTTFTTSRPAC